MVGTLEVDVIVVRRVVCLPDRDSCKLIVVLTDASARRLESSLMR
jgi:hypothetical protein